MHAIHHPVPTGTGDHVTQQLSHEIEVQVRGCSRQPAGGYTQSTCALIS